jgi:carbon-monoxide dehydrogenase small subunit
MRLSSMGIKQRKSIVALTVNGDDYELGVEPQQTLLEVLRNSLTLTGTKEGCGTGECGTCTVLIDGVPMLSCMVLAVNCRNRKITTIEGLHLEGGLSIIQEAFLNRGAVQCGFCTPGMILATTALLETNPKPGAGDIKKALEGHLCRCTGYNKIVAAVEEAAARIAGSENEEC